MVKNSVGLSTYTTHVPVWNVNMQAVTETTGIVSNPTQYTVCAVCAVFSVTGNLRQLTVLAHVKMNNADSSC